MGAEQLQIFNTKIEEIKTVYQTKIAEAANAGRFEEVNSLSLEMADQIQQCVKSLEEANASEFNEKQKPQVYTYKSDFTALDFNKFVYDGERAHYEAILKDEVLSKFIRPHSDPVMLNAISAELAKTSLKLDLRFSDNLRQAVERCTEILKLTKPLNIYVSPSPVMNAFCYPPEPHEVRIGITSALLEKSSAAELCFILGHELGHAIMSHNQLSAQQVMNTPGVTPLQIMRVMAWKRAAEVTADRMGLMCGESFEKSTRSLFKVSYGFDIEKDEALHHYVNEFEKSTKTMAENIQPEDLISTHPFGPLRLMALRYFSQSEVFSQFVGKPKFEYDKPTMESKIHEIISVFESSYLNNPENLTKDVKDFLFLGAIAVSASDGNVDEQEVLAISNMLKRPVDKLEVQQTLDAGPTATYARLKEISLLLDQNLLINDRLFILRDICVIALADGKIMQSEFEVLTYIADFLNISPRFVEDFFNSHTQPPA